MQDRRPCSALLLAALFACTAPENRSSTGEQKLQDLVQSAGYEPLPLSTTLYVPGTVLDSDTGTVVAFASDYFPASGLRSDNAAWLQKIEGTVVTETNFGLLRGLAGDASLAPKEFEAGYASTGIARYRMKFGNAWVDSVSAVGVLDAVDGPESQSRVRNAIYAGEPVVMQAVRVEDFTLAFYDEQDEQLSLTAPLARKLLGVGLEHGMKETLDGAYASQGPVYIGIKSETLKEAQTALRSGKEREPNDTRSEAVWIAVDGNVRGVVGESSDSTDYFMIRPERSGYFRFEVKNTSPKGKSKARIRKVYLEDSSGTVLTQTRPAQVRVGNSAAGRSEILVEPGLMYFLRVTNKPKYGPVEYSLYCSLTPR